jgi:1,4-alpha-glucan branching enzyme
VKQMLLDWFTWLQDTFQFDAFRVDAAGHMARVSCWCCLCLGRGAAAAGSAAPAL